MSGGMQDLVPMADYRNRLLEDILDAVQGGGGGGDGFLGRLLGSLPSLGALIGGGAVALAGIIAAKLNPVNLAKVLGDKIGDVLPGDLVDPVEMTASALIKSPLAITAGMLIASKAVIGAGDVIADKATIAAKDLWEQVTGDPAPSESGAPETAEGMTRAEAERAISQVGNAGSDAVGQVGQSAADNPFKTAAGVGLVAAGGALTFGTGGLGSPIGAGTAAKGAGILGLTGLAAQSAAGQRSRGGMNRTQNTTVRQNNTVNVTVDGAGQMERELERKLEQAKMDAVEEAVAEVERTLSSGGRGGRP
jgi:hypothetical protein